jgi:hypothetical protein
VSTPYSYSQRGTFASGPAIAIKEFTDGSGNARVMPQVSLSLATGTGDYNEIQQIAQSGTNCIPIALVGADGTVIDNFNNGSINALNVALVDATGGQVTSFGGGTQYTEGDSDASITGGAILFEGTGDILRVPSNDYPLPIKLIDEAGSEADIISGGLNVNLQDQYGNLVDTTALPGSINAINVAILDSNGDQVDITQYSRDDTPAPIKGFAIFHEGTGNAMHTASAGTPFPIKIVSDESDHPYFYASGETVDAYSKGVLIGGGNTGDGVKLTNVINATTEIDTAQATDLYGIVTNSVIRYRDADSGDFTTVGGGVATPDYNNRGLFVRPILGDRSTSGTLDMTDSAANVAFANINGYATATVSVSGTWTGTVAFMGSVDGTNFFDIPGHTVGKGHEFIETFTANGDYTIPIAGLKGFKTQVRTTGSGTANVSSRLSYASGRIYDLPDVETTGSIAMSSTSNAVTMSNIHGVESALVETTGTWTGTIICEGSLDNSTYYAIFANNQTAAETSIASTFTSNQLRSLNITGFNYFRVRCSVVGTGTANVRIKLVENSKSFYLDKGLPTGTNSIGTVVTSGGVSHDSADSGQPVKIGGKAVSGRPTAVSASDRVDAYYDLHGSQMVRTANQYQDNGFTVNHVPAANTQATKNQAAAGSGLCNVCTGISATWSADGTAPTAAQRYVYLRDGASGSGTILWAGTLSLPATAGASTGIAISGLWIKGTANTSMTLEFSSAGGANTYEVVTMTGVIVAG